MDPLAQAVQLLNQGQVVALPTETVYGLAARVDLPDAIRKIFSTKARPFFDPLIVHVASVEQARGLASIWSERADALARHFWPGPLTLVVQKSKSVDPLITSGLETVGLRCPSHPVALEILRRVGVALAAPSANRFGRTSPSRASHVREEFGNDVFVVDGGDCEIGIESTIVAVEGDRLRLLRPGAITPEQISEVLGQRGLPSHWEPVANRREAPGQMAHHYMPNKPLIITTGQVAESVLKNWIEAKLSELPAEREGVALLRPDRVTQLRTFTLSNDPKIAARELYQRLRDEAAKPGDVLVLQWPLECRDGEWAGLWDRLRKAASLHFDGLLT